MKRSTQAKRDAKQLFRLCLVNGLLDEVRIRQVVQRVGESKNRNRHNVLAALQQMVKLDFDRHTATVASATPLTVELQASIQEKLTQLYGLGVTTSFTVNPSLIGGVRIQIGSDVYDSSVKARLADLEARF